MDDLRTPQLSPVQSIPLTLIDPPAFNPRESFPDEEIRSLADSIAAVGLLHPVIVRPMGDRYELVAGECRMRAVELLQETSIDCSVRDLTDVECAEIRLLENLDRQSLNAAEIGNAISGLLRDGYGHTVETLAALLRTSEEDIVAKTRLADLPEFWQKWMREERDPRRGLAAERLVDWVEFPDVLEAMQVLIENQRWPMVLAAWQRELTNVVLRLSRSMGRKSPVGPLFKVTAELRERLQVREIRVGKELHQRAMNCLLWDEHQDRANAQPPATSKSSNGKKSNGRKTVADTKSETRADDSLAVMADGPAIADEGPDAGDFEERLARWTDGWYRQLLFDRITAMALPEIESLVVHLDIDREAAWSTTRDFLELHNGRQLLELAERWQIDVSDAQDRGEVIASLLATKRQHSLPPAVLQAAELVDATLRI